MSIDLSVALVFGVEVQSRAAMRRLEALDNDPYVEVWTVGDRESVVLFVRASYVMLAAGRYDVRRAVFPVCEHIATRAQHEPEWRALLADAMRRCEVTFSEPCIGWQIVSNAR